MTADAEAQPHGRGPGRPRDPEVDEAILRAALDLLIERGVEGTSIEQIAKHAGVGKLSVYRRWSSKEELLARALESAREPIPEPSIEHVADVPVTELVERLLPAIAEAVAAPRFRAMMTRVLGSSTSHPTLMATYWKHYVLPRRHATRVLLERAKQEGVLAEHTDLEVLMDMMAGALMYRLVRPDPPDAAELRRYLGAVYREAGLLPAHGD